MREYRDLWKRFQSSIFGRCIHSHTAALWCSSASCCQLGLSGPREAFVKNREKNLSCYYVVRQPEFRCCCCCCLGFINSDAARSVAPWAVSPPQPIKTAAQSVYCSAANRSGTWEIFFCCFFFPLLSINERPFSTAAMNGNLPASSASHGNFYGVADTLTAARPPVPRRLRAALPLSTDAARQPAFSEWGSRAWSLEFTHVKRSRPSRRPSQNLLGSEKLAAWSEFPARAQ